MGLIRKLPDDVASRIAAGEVIERPASVLKELLENALDAGASKITVEVRGGGRKAIRVVDDGSGMSPEDCREAFGRHSTSKISSLGDLDTLRTFGFRGEALFSVAAVARVSLTSCLRGTRKAWRVEVEGGRLRAEREAPPADGTTIEVLDLFFNTPARAKFLKSDASERSHLTRVVEETALAHPRVSFTYKSDGRTLLRLTAHRGSGEAAALRERVREVLGSEHGDSLLSAERESGEVSLTAFLAPTERLNPSRELQYVFVNRRPVTSRTVQQALYRAYEPFRPKNRHPVAVLYLRLPSDRLDVNVHPNKREVRFRPDSSVFETVASSLSKALLESKGIPTLGASPVDAPAPRPATSARGILDELGSPSMLRESVAAAAFRASRKDRPVSIPAPQHASLPMDIGHGLRYLGQIERAYLLFESAGGLLVVDQHAAQERVLFERYVSELESGRCAVQKLMLPVLIDMPASGVQRVLSHKDRLRRTGIEIEPFGKTGLHVTSVPTLLHAAGDVKDMVNSLLDTLASPRAAAADLRYDATAMIACKAAVKAHDALTAPEALRLVEDLRACKDPSCCPHGRPSMLSLSRDELARRFERSGPPRLSH